MRVANRACAENRREREQGEAGEAEEEACAPDQALNQGNGNQQEDEKNRFQNARSLGWNRAKAIRISTRKPLEI